MIDGKMFGCFGDATCSSRQKDDHSRTITMSRTLTQSSIERNEHCKRSSTPSSTSPRVVGTRSQPALHDLHVSALRSIDGYVLLFPVIGHEDHKASLDCM